MKLNNRLATIASLVDGENIKLADVGCDHGFLAINLVLENKIDYAYAMDVNQGPLNNVKSNIEKYNLNNSIQTILSDGLIELNKEDFNQVVIAGMGGSLIVDILGKEIDKIQGKTLYLQPNVNSYALRKFLLMNNFGIIDEVIIEDNGILYEVIKAQQPLVDKKEYNELELLFGRINLDRNDANTKKLLLEYAQKTEKILTQMPKENVKRSEFTSILKQIKDYLKN